MKWLLVLAAGCWTAAPSPPAPRPQPPPKSAAFTHPTTLGGDCIGGVAANDHAVFWLTHHGLATRPLAGGAQRTLADDETIRDFKVDGEHVVFATITGIERIEADGTGRVLLAGKRSPHWLAIDDRDAYWTELTTRNYELWAVPRTGGPPRKLGESVDELAGLAASDNRIYATIGSGGVSSIPKRGGVFQHDATQDADSPVGLAAAPGRVAWASGAHGTIEQIVGGNNIVLYENHTMETTAVAIAADDAVVFATRERDGAQLELARGPRVERLLRVPGGSIEELAVYGRDVFWTERSYSDAKCRVRAMGLP